MNQKIILAASILSAKLAILGQEVSQVLQAGVDWIHFDTMDHHFVPNLTFGPPLCSAIRDFGIKAPIDVHIMALQPDRLIKDFADSGANLITIHPSTTYHLHRSIQLIKDHGMQAGIALNPDLDPSQFANVFSDLDLILLMAVNPGFAGQKFIPTTINKIIKTKHLTNELNPNIKISVDGGINQNIAHKIISAGADVLVAGTAIFKAEDKITAIKQLRGYS